MADLNNFKMDVRKLLRDNDRCDIDTSKILKIYYDLSSTDDETMEEITPTSQDVYEKLIEIYPEKKCFNDRKEATDDEFFNNF